MEWVHKDLPQIIQKNYIYYPVKSVSLQQHWCNTLNL